jgi:hypothetical protein
MLSRHVLDEERVPDEDLVVHRHDERRDILL